MGHEPGPIRAGDLRGETPVNLACLPAADICKDHHRNATSARSSLRRLSSHARESSPGSRSLGTTARAPNHL